MIHRCHNPEHKSYRHYGARGISVCSRWRKDYLAFVQDMGRRPSKRHSLDRKNNDKGYTPRNCRWVLPEEQANNTRASKYLTHKGVTLTRTQWARRISPSDPHYLAQRFYNGWTVADAMRIPKGGKR